MAIENLNLQELQDMERQVQSVIERHLMTITCRKLCEDELHAIRNKIRELLHDTPDPIEDDE